MFRFLVVGDVMLDRYTYVSTERNAAEADMPVWDEVASEIRPGGAANVALNLASLDESCEVDLLFLGSERVTMMLYSLANNLEAIRLPEEDIVKHRYVSTLDNSYVARFDNKKCYNNTATTFEVLMDLLDRKSYDGVIVSDYRMGTITSNVAKLLCNKKTKVFVDSKRKDLSMYDGAYVIKLNSAEAAVQSSQAVQKLCHNYIVTLGADGCEIVKTHRSSGYTSFATVIDGFKTDSVIDVTGCGDTFIAALAYHDVTKNTGIDLSCKFANFCASKVVSKFGTSIIGGKDGIQVR